MAMGFRDEKYQLEGEAEVDDAFVTVVRQSRAILKNPSEVEDQ